MTYAISISGHTDSADTEDAVFKAVREALAQVRNSVGYARVTTSTFHGQSIDLLDEVPHAEKE